MEPQTDKGVEWVTGLFSKAMIAIVAILLVGFWMHKEGVFQRVGDNSVNQYQQDRINNMVLELEKQLGENDTILKANKAYQFSLDWPENGALTVDLDQNASIKNIAEVVSTLHEYALHRCHHEMATGSQINCKDLSLSLKIYVK